MIPYEWRYPIQKPRYGGITEEWPPIRLETTYNILFRAESRNLWTTKSFVDTMYRYVCYDCYYATGDPEAFVTSYARLADIATSYQQEEMSNHAKQHSIMWAWVNSIERKK